MADGFCINCGLQLNAKWFFCGSCGTALHQDKDDGNQDSEASIKKHLYLFYGLLFGSLALLWGFLFSPESFQDKIFESMWADVIVWIWLLVGLVNAFLLMRRMLRHKKKTLVDVLGITFFLDTWFNFGWKRRIFVVIPCTLLLFGFIFLLVRLRIYFFP